ncbi:MAG: OmpA family protein [Bacteroidia bacterium]|nr:OmpA family protein [Bacteroidia bacterium]
MKVWILGLAMAMVLLSSACDSTTKEEKQAQEQAMAIDNQRKSAQLYAWKVYAEDMYYRRREPRSTFAPVSARDPKPALPPEPFLSGMPEQSGTPVEEIGDKPAFPVGTFIKKGEILQTPTARLFMFPKGSQIIPPDQYGLLQEIATVLHRNTDVFKISVVGYASEEEVNDKELLTDQWTLSSSRATTVVKELIRLGISPHHLEAIGRGSFTMDSDTGRRSIDIFLTPIDLRP